MSLLPEHEKVTAFYCAQGACFKHCVLSETLLVSSKPPFPSPAFPTPADGFPSEEESPSFPRTPLTMKSSRAEGVDCLSPKTWTRDQR